VQVFGVCTLVQAFQSMAKGDKQAMAKYNEQQVKQLTRLIEVTRTDIAKVGMVLQLLPLLYSHQNPHHACQTTTSAALYRTKLLLSCCCCGCQFLRTMLWSTARGTGL